MATVFNKRLFGTDLDPEVKNKLRARQILAKHSTLPNQSNQFVQINGQEYKIKDLVGDVNFSLNDDKTSLLDMSSRTPFARMWVVVEIHDGKVIHNRVDISDKELDEFIESMDQSSFELVSNFFETMPKLIHEVTVTNPKTKKKNNITIVGMQSFF